MKQSPLLDVDPAGKSSQVRYRLRFGDQWLLEDLASFATAADISKCGYVVWETDDRDHAVKVAEQWAAWRPATFDDGAEGLSFGCPDIVTRRECNELGANYVI